MWVHKPGRHNIDALSRKEVASSVGSLILVVIDFKQRVSLEAAQDSTYQKMVEQVKEGTIRRYWLKNELLYFR